MRVGREGGRTFRRSALALALASAACARIEPPPGGPPDVDPPQLVATIPDSMARVPGFRGSVEFRFDEVVSEGGTPSTGTGTGDLEVLILTDNPPFDFCHYPDSNKWGGRYVGGVFRIERCDYFAGEEEPLPAGTGSATPPPPLPSLPPIAPFAQRRIATDALPWENFDSPKGKFRGESKSLSVALGANPKLPVGGGGHPFDLELGRLPAGFSGCPYHIHSSQWELFWILEGTGTVRTEAGLTPVGPGDLVLHPPGEAHQLTNTGTGDLTYYLVADNPPVDIWQYPDSQKWGFNAPRKFFRPVETPYWDGEE